MQQPYSNELATKADGSKHARASFEVGHHVHTVAYGPPGTYKRGPHVQSPAPELVTRRCTAVTSRHKWVLPN